MTARTFGRKGMAAGASAIAPSRRAALVPPAPVDEAELPRAASVPEEPAPAGQPVVSAAPAPDPAAYPHKSLPLAYVLWLFMGWLGAHRFYLGRPLTAALLACAWATSWALVFGQYYTAFAGVLAVGWWVFIDGFLVRRMHRIATTGAA